jgi:DNA-binding XRE family transcriptional regulator
MKATELIEVLAKKLGISAQAELAEVLGVSVQTLINWKNQQECLSTSQVANALIKARYRAVEDAHYHMIKPIVEFFEIDWTESRQGAKWEIFPSGKDSEKIYRGLRETLDSAWGIYIFYDSRGQAIYVGKAKDQSLWKEMNLAYNRDRGELQTIKRVAHSYNKDFSPAYESPLQPTLTHVQLHEMASYFSAYAVTSDMIEDVEALLIRGFANDLLNKKMERFVHAKS